MRMDGRNTLGIKSELYDPGPLSYGRHLVPQLEEIKSPWKPCYRRPHPLKKCVWTGVNTLRIKSELYDTEPLSFGRH